MKTTKTRLKTSNFSIVIKENEKDYKTKIESEYSS